MGRLSLSTLYLLCYLLIGVLLIQSELSFGQVADEPTVLRTSHYETVVYRNGTIKSSIILPNGGGAVYGGFQLSFLGFEDFAFVGTAGNFTPTYAFYPLQPKGIACVLFN